MFSYVYQDVQGEIACFYHDEPPLTNIHLCRFNGRRENLHLITLGSTFCYLLSSFTAAPSTCTPTLHRLRLDSATVGDGDLALRLARRRAEALDLLDELLAVLTDSLPYKRRAGQYYVKMDGVDNRSMRR